MKIEGSKFYDSVIDIDGIAYADCLFKNCTLRYSGGDLPSFIGCQMTDTAFSFSGPASNTIELLQIMYRSDMKIFAESAIELIKTSETSHKVDG